MKTIGIVMLVMVCSVALIGIKRNYEASWRDVFLALFIFFGFTAWVFIAVVLIKRG